MSLTAAKIKTSLKEQLLQEEKDLQAELAAVQDAKGRAKKAKKAKTNN